MDILIGLLIIAIGSFCQSSSYVPIKKVKEWSWESFQGSQTALFVVLPSFKFSFSFSFAKCAFSNTAQQVFFHVNAFA